MAPLIEVSQEVLKGLEQLKIPYTLKENPQRSSDFINLPAMNLSVAKQRTLQGKTWYETQKELKKQGLDMLTILEFVEFLKYVKDNSKDTYEDITAVRNPWRAEWLDAYFERRADGLYMLTKNKTIAEKLDDDTLMKDRQISLESWLSNPTSQGLPRGDVKKGSLYYWYPRADSVARFGANSGGADLYCDWYPSAGGSILGVRAVRHE